jgi:hypothetical protein
MHRHPRRDKQKRMGVHLAVGLTGRSGPDRRRRAHTHLLVLTVGEDWPARTGLLDLLTVHTARLLYHPAWKEIKRATHRPSTIPFRLQKFNA